MSEHVRSALASVVEGRTLSMDEARLAMGAVMDGEATPAQLAALLDALRMRGETVEELAGFASAMRERGTAMSSDTLKGLRARRARDTSRRAAHSFWRWASSWAGGVTV